MTTVSDGLFQFGGVPVGTNLDTNKIFSTSTQGRAWFVNTADGTNGNGRSPAQAFTTMQSAFNNLASGDIIYFVGKVTESLTTPVQVFDVTIVGCGNLPRTADSTPTGGNYAASSWTSAAAGTPALKIIQQGWRLINIFYTAPASAAAVQLFRDGGAGNAERDASHANIVGCHFSGGQNHIEFNGGLTNVVITGCKFNGSTAAALKNTTGAGIGTNYIYTIAGNIFQGCASNIVVPTNQASITGNTIGAFTTSGIDLSGGVGKNSVFGNQLAGTYSVVGGYASANANDSWFGNFADVAGGITQADPA